MPGKMRRSSKGVAFLPLGVMLGVLEGLYKGAACLERLKASRPEA